MTDAGIEEIYQLVAQALNSGQKSVPVHIFPFTMNDENMRQAQAWPEYNFWRMLKPGYDYFEKIADCQPSPLKIGVIKSAQQLFLNIHR
ncbi:hypothetical protein RB531_1906 [Salmonella enterica subsp. enterica serovar Typhimurium]